MSVTVGFSAAGTLVSEAEENHQSKMVTNLVVTVANDEVVTIDHGKDPDIRRRVDVIDTSDGSDAAIAGTMAVARTDSDTTTITASAGGAGTYRIIIEI